MWALYDDYKLPRYYGEITNVAHSPTFSCKVMWLHAEEKETVPGCYFAAGLLKSSLDGERCLVMAQDNPAVFSHLVVPHARSYPLEIMPRLGEVWAFFVPRNKEAAAGNRERFEPKLDRTQDKNLVYVLGEIQGEEEEGMLRVMYLRNVPGYTSVYEVRILLTLHLSLLQPTARLA